MTTVVIGTRKSRLAMWQTETVARRLNDRGIDTIIRAMETKGDKVLDRTIAKIGSKGVFTEELEEQLADGDTDIAVHSAKDMQSILPDGFELIAFTERERSHDVLLSRDRSIRIEDRSRPLTVGTSSVRRIAFLKRYCPQVVPVDMRGNLQTRVRKLDDGACDALMLAYAGVKRMGYEQLIVHAFDEERFIPPVGQGCIAIEAARSLDGEKRSLVRRCLNNEESERCLLAERAFLRTLEGGCSIPAFGRAVQRGTTLHLSGGLANLDGSWLLSRSVSGPASDPEALGTSLGRYILEHGGLQTLQSIKAELQQE